VLVAMQRCGRRSETLPDVPPQPSKIALPEVFPPGPPCDASLSHPAMPVQHQPKAREGLAQKGLVFFLSVVT
jgi:hypothetical protein